MTEGFLGSGSQNDDDFSIFLKQKTQGGTRKKPLWSIRGKAPLAWEVTELELFAYANCAPGASLSREKFTSPENEAGKSPCLIADTSSNDYFSSVILVFGGVSVYINWLPQFWKLPMPEKTSVRVSWCPSIIGQKAKKPSPLENISQHGKRNINFKSAFKWGICWFSGSNHPTIDSKR